MSGQCNAPCATINERRRGMMNKFQGLIDCYDNAPFREKMRCPPATLREFPTLVERSQLLACYPVCCPAPCDPCPPMCSPCPPACPPCLPCPPCPSPCPPPMCLPCPPPCYPCPPCPSPYEQCLARMQAEDEKRARNQDELNKRPRIVSNQVQEIRPTSDFRRTKNEHAPGVEFVDAEQYFKQQSQNEGGGSDMTHDAHDMTPDMTYCCVPMCFPCPVYICAMPEPCPPGQTAIMCPSYNQEDGNDVEGVDGVGGVGGGRQTSKAPNDSRELRGGVLYTGCECVKRNGLQHDCRRSECQGAPPCLTKPWPDCKPSGGTGTKGVPPRVSNYPHIPESCSPAPPRQRGPPVPDHEHRAGMTCEQCEPPIKYAKPNYLPQCPPMECPKPKLNHYPMDRIPPHHTELKGGQVLSRCDCIRRNGLQDDCKLHDCGIPECLFKPDPECIPSGGRGPQGGSSGGSGGNGNGKINGVQKCIMPICIQPCPSSCGPCPPCPPPRLENCLVECPPSCKPWPC